MIVTTATFSLDKAREVIARGWPAQHPFLSYARAWVGFDVSDASDDVSPLRDTRRVADGPSLAMRVGDVDLDSEWRGHREQYGTDHPLAPTIEHARRIVGWVLARHLRDERYALAVHCHAGLYRSGAVVEWVRADLGVPEHDCSTRVVVCGRDEPTHNATLLRLLRQAHAEVTR